MEIHPPATGSDLDSSSEELAKAWLIAIVERRPLDRVGDVDLDVLSTQAAPLIAGVLRALAGEPDGGADLDELGRPAQALARLRRGATPSAETHRDLATLQSLLIASLGNRRVLRPSGDVLTPLRRLAEIFGTLHAAVTDDPSSVPAGGEPRPATPSSISRDGDLDGSLDARIAEYRRYGHPFALALLEVEGLEEIYETRGRESGDWMSNAATAMIRNQIRIVDRAFRVERDMFCVLAPNVDAGKLRRLGDRLARVVDGSQAEHGPRISISAGVSACPEHGHDRERLLEIARAALDSARATGAAVEIATLNGAPVTHET